MSTPGRATKSPRSTIGSDAFAQAVERALELFNTPERLADESPLAAPYFLDGAITGGARGHNPASRGVALQQLLRDASTALPPDQQRLLTVSFFERDTHLNNIGIVRQLNLSEATYYRHRAAALNALANALNERAVPPLRNELPRSQTLIARTPTLDACVNALKLGACVALTGPSGIGKTAVGARIAEAWGQHHTFWFTVRPALNDQFENLIFALGHFLRGLGHTGLWRQLVADRGRTTPAQALGLLRHDLDKAGRTALICIDEADLLRPETRNGAQLLHMLEDARALTPLLLIGQQLVIEPDAQHALLGLSAGDIARWFADEGHALEDPSAVASATRGNPAMLRLLLSLLKSGDALRAAIDTLAGSASSETLFNRLWRRLGTDERRVLAALSVHDSPAPADAFAVAADEINMLIERGLAQSDDRGGLSVITTARGFVRDRVTPEVLAELHLDAARLREARGEYTLAASHYLAAGHTSVAIWLLHRHRDVESARGHALTARELLRTVRASDLPEDDDRRALALLRAEHALIVGDAERADDELGAVGWPESHAATQFARELRGYAFEQRGQIEQALALYRSELKRVGDGNLQLIERLHVKTGYAYLYRIRDLPQAERAARLALHQAQEFMGLVAEEDGRYDDAIAYYSAALDTAAQIEHGAAAQAATHSHLGHLHMRRGDAARAIEHLHIALRHTAATGQQVHGLYHRLNLSSALIVAERHDEAVEQADQALTLATAIGNSFLVAGLHAARGEALLGLGREDEAEQAALASLREEEDVHRPYALTVLGRAQIARHGVEAQRTLRAAVESAAAVNDRYAEAHAWRALATASEGDARAAAQQTADTLFHQLGLTRLG